ncbi:MAG: 2-(1,2-epoxy,2-dihydrophenyl)acetyl-CoA isomerase [Thermoleophilaceae bacterium]|nr:2-(1,2-epoxy,2-dihydrophenyl)acetyl-CoA isomerase [Thermoleophilaceae bacterium]
MLGYHRPMGSTGSVRLERRDSVAWIVFERPEARNAMTLEMRARLLELLAEAEADADAAAIVVAGAGEHFCGGGDIASLAELGDAWDGRTRTATAGALVSGVLHAEKPTIAIARGSVVGLGVSLFCACDLRLAGEDARFQAGFPGVGLIPDGGLLYLLPRLIGWGRARDWMLLGRPIDAPAAVAWGLASEAVASGSLAARAAEIGERLAGLSAQALAQTKAG